MSRLSPNTRRSILGVLTATRLREITESFDLDVADRRTAESNIDAIVRKKSLDFSLVLATFSRAELKSACEAIGIDSTGREKDALIERLVTPGDSEDPSDDASGDGAQSGFPIQADSLKRLRALLSAIDDRTEQPHDRQTNYYVAAARALALIDDAQRVTPTGRRILDTQLGSRDEAVALRDVISSTPLVSSVAPDLFADVAPSGETLAKNIAQQHSHALATAARRAGSLLRWREQILSAINPHEPPALFFSDRALGATSDEPVEVEDESGDEGPHKPWNPDEIRVDPKAFSLRQIIDYIDDKDIDLAPDFQRQEVWKLPQKVRLMESILLRIPLPAFYFDAEKNGLMHVVDGLQRLSTIHAFFKGHFELAAKHLEYLRSDPTVCDKKFDELDSAWKRRIQNTQIMAHVIDPQTPAQVKFNIFKRINTGGSPLTLQEMRHCMMTARARDVLKAMCGLDAFAGAVPRGVVSHARMIDRELALRFAAFRLLTIETYDGDMDAFLSTAAARLDTLDAQALTTLVGVFERAMSNATRLFGEHAFRKWPAGNDRLQPLNKPLFESLSVALADSEPATLDANKKVIVSTFRSLLRDDPKFSEAITTSTGDVNKVRLRFETASTVLQVTA